MQEYRDQLWQEYYHLLLLFIQSRVKDKNIARDILHDVFLKVEKNISTLKENSKIKSWLFQITRNAIIDHYRSLKKGVDISELDEELNLDQEQHTEVIEEIGGCINPIIKNMPGTYREPLFLSEIQGYSQKEVARRLAISYSAAKMRIQRGRTLLKKTLMEYCAFEYDSCGSIIDYTDKGDYCRKIKES